MINHQGTSGLNPSMSRLNGLGLLVSDPREAVRCRRGEAHLDILLQCPLIAFESQHIVAPLVEDLLGNRPLAAHGVDGHDTASDGQLLQEFGQGGDLIGFRVDGDLGEDQPVRCRPGTHHMDRSLAGGIMRSPDRLAIEGDHFVREDGPHRRHPGPETLLELDRVEDGKHAVEGVVGGDAMREIQEGC